MQVKWWWYGQPLLIAVLGLAVWAFMGGLPLEGMLAGLQVLVVVPAVIFLLGAGWGLCRAWTHRRTWYGKIDGCKHCDGPLEPFIGKCGICGRRGR